MTTSENHIENKTTSKIWQFNGGVGSYAGVYGAWLASVNGYVLGEKRPGRGQVDPLVFATRAKAREAVRRIVRIRVEPEHAGSQNLCALIA